MTWVGVIARLRASWESRQGRSRRNSASLLAAQVVERAAGYGFLVYVTRSFGATLYGTYQTVATLFAMAGTLCDFGLANLVTRDVAKDRKRASEFLSKLILLKAVLTLGAYGLLLVAIQVLGFPWDVTGLVALASLTSLWGLLTGLLGPSLVGYERADLTSTASMVASVCTAGLGILALHLGMGLSGVLGGWFLVGGLQAGLLMRMARREGIVMRAMVDGRLAREALKRATPFGLIAIGLIHNSTAIVVLSHSAGPEAVGFYAAARRPLELLFVIPASILGALYPVMASYHRQASPLFLETYLRNVHLMIRLAVPIVVGCSLAGESIMALLFGEPFRMAGSTFRVLSWALALAFMTSAADSVIYSAEWVQGFLRFFWLKVLVHVGLDLFLIPRWSYLGAGWATLASEVVDFLTHVYFIQQVLGHVPKFQRLALGVLPPALGMAGVMMMLRDHSILFSLLGGLTAYGLVLLLECWTFPSVESHVQGCDAPVQREATSPPKGKAIP